MRIWLAKQDVIENLKNPLITQWETPSEWFNKQTKQHFDISNIIIDLSDDTPLMMQGSNWNASEKFRIPGLKRRNAKALYKAGERRFK